MKLKYLFILLLLVLLVLTVQKMMQYESSVREERKITLFVEDDSKPLFTKLPEKELRSVALGAEYNFMAKGDFFKRQHVKYLETEKLFVWDDIFLKGVNLGVAVPGKFPAEFSLNFDQYLDWLKKIGEMNANTVRIYTILPPQFYQAFSYYNLHHNDKPLYLMQGVWTEVPTDENYFNPDFTREFGKEMIDAINVIHGNAVLKESPGKASGVYSTDVSKYVVALLLGREWEPGSVAKTNQLNNMNHFSGDFINMNEGNAMEAWLAEMMEFAVLYETQEYHFQHPVSFVNWLPLDPMFHNTEIIENNKVREYDNDLESVDFSKFYSTDLFSPGIFAAYHAYPYYPDFVYLQSNYLDSTDTSGEKNPFLFYLKDLKKHNQGMPLIIAEYGLPSSRGNSHVSPFGMHQGGHSEDEQARLSLKLTEDIVNSNCGGAVYFEWIDEWFKHNWLVMDFEQPADDRKLWHNLENPEQNFGILAMENKIKIIDGKTNDWNAQELNNELFSIQFDADASYFYIALKVSDFDFQKNSIYIAIDTYDKEKGDHSLPFTHQFFENGFEYLIEFKSPDSALILVDEPYSVFNDIYNNYIPGYTSVKNENGIFVHQLLLTNRKRASLLGEKTDSVIVDRSKLVFGNSAEPVSSNADWFYNQETNLLELRLTWHLLNVSDPAKNFVLDDKPGTSEIEYTKTDGFHSFVFVTDKTNKLLSQFPENEPFTYNWNEWDIPQFTQRLKPIYFSLQDFFSSLRFNDSPETANPVEDNFKITDFYNNKKGAASISFVDAGYSQFEYGLPVLQKYNVSASFGIIPDLLGEIPGYYQLNGEGSLKRLGTKEIIEIAKSNEIAIQKIKNEPISEFDIQGLSQKSNAKVHTANWFGSTIKNDVPEGLIFVRNNPEKEISLENFNHTKYTSVNGSVSTKKLDSIIHSRPLQWIIVVHHHLFENLTEIPHFSANSKTINLFVSKTNLDDQIRLLRNNDYWISTQADVYKYLREKETSTIKTERYNNTIFLRVNHPLDQEIYNHPLTVEYKTNARIVKIQGSESDGIYLNRNGSVFFNLLPNKEVTLEIIE